MDEVDEMCRAGVLSEAGARTVRRFMEASGKNEIEAMDHLGLWHAGGNGPAEYLRNRMRREERAAIVTWLRQRSTPDPMENWGDQRAAAAGAFADAIEAGEHLK